jgi:hypothetical protein
VITGFVLLKGMLCKRMGVTNLKKKTHKEKLVPFPTNSFENIGLRVLFK